RGAGYSGATLVLFQAKLRPQGLRTTPPGTRVLPYFFKESSMFRSGRRGGADRLYPRKSRPAARPRGWRSILLLELLENRALPSFVTAPAFPAGNSVRAVTAGDFKADGRVDLAVANYTAGTVSVLPGNGAGGFRGPIASAAGPNPIALAAAD